MHDIGLRTLYISLNNYIRLCTQIIYFKWTINITVALSTPAQVARRSGTRPQACRSRGRALAARHIDKDIKLLRLLFVWIAVLEISNWSVIYYFHHRYFLVFTLQYIKSMIVLFANYSRKWPIHDVQLLHKMKNNNRNFWHNGLAILRVLLFWDIWIHITLNY